MSAFLRTCYLAAASHGRRGDHETAEAVRRTVERLEHRRSR